MKTCFKCQRTLSLESFYKHSQMADGRLNKCKDCARSDVISHRNANVDRIRAYDRMRSAKPERMAKISAVSRNWRHKNPRKYAAHTLVNNAIRDGRLKSQPCVKCGKKAHAHHDNYDYPLDVMWLCAVHHSERHKEMKKLGIEP